MAVAAAVRAKYNSLAQAVASAKAGLVARGQQEGARGGSGNTLELRYQLGHWGRSEVLRRFQPLQLKRKIVCRACLHCRPCSRSQI